MNSSYLLIILIFIVGLLVQSKLKRVFEKYSRVRAPWGMTGAQIAEKMLRDNGIYNVRVTSVNGSLTDHFNPANMTVNLSESVYGECSVSAAAVAAHECGHAVQHAQGYAPLKLRTILVPVVNFSSMLSQIVIIAGILLINVIPALFWIGIIMFAMIFFFSLVTLPVEFNASHRAVAWLESSGTLSQQELEGAKESLKWAAMTYVVSAISALVTLVYYLGFADRRN
ncbi:MAG: zinc metallopeptidase [Bacteroidales bacterium]|nr:zinc metallopeptidase [Bacteroidales bacterium]